MTWINYDALCGKHSLLSTLPHLSLLIYWPPTPPFSFCCCPNFPISSICFKIKKHLFGRWYKHSTSTDVFSVSARNGHTLMRFCLALFLVWRDWHCMNIFILLLVSFCLPPPPLFLSHDTVANLVFLWVVPSLLMTLFYKSLRLVFENANWPEFTSEHVSLPLSCVTRNMLSG